MAGRISADRSVSRFNGIPLPDNRIEVIRRYLQDALAAEKAFESQLRSFADDGDDEEVQETFAACAQRCSAYCVKLDEQLQTLGSEPSTMKGVLAHLFFSVPRTLQLNHLPEERLTQNLMIAYTLETGHCAMYEALSIVSNLAGFPAIAAVAADIRREEQKAALRFWSFLPSRAKIAFNILTAGEVDPSVETRTQDLRLI